MVRLSLRSFSQKWDIMASVVLGRSPVIAPPMSAIEAKFHRLQLEEEREKSLMCNYELKTKQDEKILARREQLINEGKELSELDEAISVMNSVLEDEWKRKADELEKKYKFTTESPANDGKSLERMLDRKLVLIVKQRFGDKKYSSPWILPQIKHKDGETLRQTAERCLGEISRQNLAVNIAGNAPFSVFTHRYPKGLAARTGSIGAKIFFYQANLAQNSTEFKANGEDISDFNWVTKEEFISSVPDKSYRKAARFAFLE
ncbi:unnamed protein product [Caenorhabditis bovis]|uniref:Large ribosomal subunit protein mL46 n=1 Tax=Caenorhabditis bovis TaxID=2654633 RepID=A0A8S1EZX2_9PELO|nr:unnamed protein product [Caenorhabditis bovis]